MEVLSEGQYIKHDIYGFGVVTESDPNVPPSTSTATAKKFVTSLMTAELVGDAPPRPARSRRRRKAAGVPAKSAARRG